MEFLLSGLKWVFRQEGKKEWNPATVPGCVHTDLFSNHIIPDPFFDLNEKKIQWIEDVNWEYKTEFRIEENPGKYDIELYFGGLDTYAEIFLNGEHIHSADNMFIPWNIHIPSEKVKITNTLLILFKSPYQEGLKEFEKLPYQLPANNDEREKRVSPFTRKAPYMYGWDWGPRLLTSGIWKDGFIRILDNPFLENLYINSEYCDKDNGNIRLTAFARKLNKKKKYILKILVDNQPWKTLDIPSNEQDCLIDTGIEIDNPELWWPKNHGNQKLYTIRLELFEDNKGPFSIEKQTGFRTVELIREEDENGHKGFMFRINNKDIFIKGSNIIPLDFFVSEVKNDHYDQLIDNALAVNMNLLRCWGGGVYEDDYFYQRCNQEGIMIWQDFMFACGMYPSDEKFMENTRKEIRYHLRRLNSNPCIILWCGNNEILEGYHLWGWKEDLGEYHTNAFDSYEKIFHQLIPENIRTYAPLVPYWPSSPSSDYMEPPDISSGDLHYWDHIKDIQPYTVFEKNTGRFMSEFGFKSYPELSTIHKFLKENKIDSEAMEEHQGWPGGLELIEKNLKWFYPEAGSFEEFIFMSQLLQADAICFAIESHRRAMPECMGTVYWQLNDCWPSATWSSIDYYGNWKALHYRLPKVYADILISTRIEENQLSVYLVNDTEINCTARLSIQLFSFEGKLLKEEDQTLKLKENASVKLPENICLKEDDEHSRNNVYFKLELYESENKLASRIVFPGKAADLKLEHPKINFEYDKIKGQDILIVSSNVLVKNLFLSYPGEKVFFSDNYFDLLPNSKKTLLMQTKESIDLKNIIYTSLNHCIH